MTFEKKNEKYTIDWLNFHDGAIEEENMIIERKWINEIYKICPSITRLSM